MKLGIDHLQIIVSRNIHCQRHRSTSNVTPLREMYGRYYSEIFLSLLFALGATEGAARNGMRAAVGANPGAERCRDAPTGSHKREPGGEPTRPKAGNAHKPCFSL
jgi:hypothetical protein